MLSAATCHRLLREGALLCLHLWGETVLSPPCSRSPMWEDRAHCCFCGVPVSPHPVWSKEPRVTHKLAMFSPKELLVSPVRDDSFLASPTGSIPEYAFKGSHVTFRVKQDLSVLNRGYDLARKSQAEKVWPSQGSRQVAHIPGSGLGMGLEGDHNCKDAHKSLYTIRRLLLFTCSRLAI